MATEEQEILDAQRARAKAQELLPSSVRERLPAAIQTGWYDTAVDPRVGFFAVVRDDGEQEDLIGEVLRVSWQERSVLVYVLGARAVTYPLALSRPAFLAVEGLYVAYIDADVEICE